MSWLEQLNSKEQSKKERQQKKLFKNLEEQLEKVDMKKRYQ